MLAGGWLEVNEGESGQMKSLSLRGVFPSMISTESPPPQKKGQIINPLLTTQAQPSSINTINSHVGQINTVTAG